MNTAILINEAKKNSAAAQKCLFDMLADNMIMVCRRYLKSPEDAEEKMLDGFYKFFQKIGSFQYHSDAQLYGWLKRIMVNECLMFLRKKNVFILVSESLAEDVSLSEDVLDHLSAREIFHLIIQLPTGYRTVFNLYVIEGMAHKEIAKVLNISEGTSKSQLSKAKALLQKILLQNGIKDVAGKTK